MLSPIVKPLSPPQLELLKAPNREGRMLRHPTSWLLLSPAAFPSLWDSSVGKRSL